jgi:hypothetical protein
MRLILTEDRRLKRDHETNNMQPFLYVHPSL